MKSIEKGMAVRHARWRGLTGVVESIELDHRGTIVRVRHDDGSVQEYEREWIEPAGRVV